MSSNNNKDSSRGFPLDFSTLAIGTAFAFAVAGGSYLYYKHHPSIKLTQEQAAEFVNKTVVITGANSGIGFAAADQLARLGANVIIACRDQVNGALAVENIQASSGNPNVSFEELDLSDFSSIQLFSRRIKRCHILINNAGAMFSDRQLTNGIEKTMLTNYLGPWYLTRLLLPVLARTSIEENCETKIINVGSRLEKYSTLGLDYISFGRQAINNLFLGPKQYDVMSSYSNSKLANYFFTYELSRRVSNPSALTSLLTYQTSHFANFQQKVPRISVAIVTPGMVNTNLSRYINPYFLYLTYPFRAMVLKSPQQGGLELVYVASQSNVNGKYYGERKEIQSSETSHSLAIANDLWDVTEKYVRDLSK